MDFKNSGFMYLLGVLVGLFVIAQSVYFLVKAVRRSRELGIAGNVVKRTIASSAVFAILPSVSILLGLITLANTLGLPLPWIRLSVLGAVTYELPAATWRSTPSAKAFPRRSAVLLPSTRSRGL